MINTQNNKSNIYRLLAKPSFGRPYLLNALDSNSETVFLEALHQIIEALTEGSATAIKDEMKNASSHSYHVPRSGSLRDRK